MSARERGGDLAASGHGRPKPYIAPNWWLGLAYIYIPHAHAYISYKKIGFGLRWLAQDGCGSRLGQSWLWQGQRVHRGIALRQNLSLKLCWAALRRIHGPSSCGDQRGYLLVKLIVVSNQSFPSGSSLGYSRRLKCQQA